MQNENWQLLLFLTTLLSFALLSILLSLAVWSSISFERHVLTESSTGRRDLHPAEGPSWAGSCGMHCVWVFRMRVCVRLVWTAANCIWPLHYRGHKARQVMWGHTDVTLVQSGVFKGVFSGSFQQPTVLFEWTKRVPSLISKYFFSPWNVPLTSTFKFKVATQLKFVSISKSNVQVISSNFFLKKCLYTVKKGLLV